LEDIMETAACIIGLVVILIADAIWRGNTPRFK
jgi:hypothetical protein